MREWRERHGHTIKTGAAALGLSTRQFSYYMSGQYPVPDTIAKLAGYLDRDLATTEQRA
jgi:transcriptional regulator with XRE-family HTH domain